MLSALTASAAVAQVESPGVKIVSLPGHVTQGALEEGSRVLLSRTGTFVVARRPTAVARISAVAKVSYGMPKALISPVVSNVRFSADAADGSVVVDGDVTNEATKNLSSLAEISAVFFDGAGNIIGGGFDFPSFGLPPGAQTAFEIDTGPGGPQASTVAQVKISVDSDYGND